MSELLTPQANDIKRRKLTKLSVLDVLEVRDFNLLYEHQVKLYFGELMGCKLLRLFEAPTIEVKRNHEIPLKIKTSN